MAPASSLVFKDILQFEINMNRSLSHLPVALCKLLFLCCLSVQAAMSLRVAPSYHLCFNLSSTESADLFKTASSKSHWFYKLMEFSCSGFEKPKVLGIRLPHVNSLVKVPISLPSLCVQLPPPNGQHPSSFLLF